MVVLLEPSALDDVCVVAPVRSLDDSSEARPPSAPDAP
jgi:hypothetical protein